ncbi:phosphotransferase [Opitutaceae bacterium]|nr:phosphotransferase [Opitutaceae bacterium]
MPSRLSQFKAQFPAALYFDANNLEDLGPLLRSLNLLGPDEPILRTEKPGEGNMNFVVRVITPRRSLIIKQSRPWVEKYPQIPAPVERLQAESAFYRVTLQEPSLSAMSPALMAVDSTHMIMVTEDLGPSADYTSIYAKDASLTAPEIDDLFNYLALLQAVSQDINPAKFPPNQDLKKLNHTHIFKLPFQTENGFDLDAVQPGLHDLAQPFTRDDALRERLTALGGIYLGAGPVLIHGDFYPGSWLRTPTGPKVIDPEFAHFGQAEFDVGVMIAHLLMARTPWETIQQSLQTYLRHGSLDKDLLVEFTGAEILRRLIGLAQLPVDLDLPEKAELVEAARGFLLNPSAANLG